MKGGAKRMITNNRGRKGGSSSKRGFAAMDPARQREIASMGGKASPANFANDPEKASRAGRIGGSR